MTKSYFLQTLASASLVLILLIQPVGFIAQTTCDSSNSPNRSNRLQWPKGANVAVNFNSNQFTQAEFDCLVPLFNTINSQSGSNGNNSGVTLTLNYNTSTLATITGSLTTGFIAEPTSIGSTFTHRYQFDKPPGGTLVDGSADFGATALNVNSTSLNTAATQINSMVSGCPALRIVVAHEVAHTFGLNHCDDNLSTGHDICAPDESVMALPACPPSGCPPSEYTNPSTGRTSFSDCDNQVIRAAGNYDDAGGGGGEGGGGGDPQTTYTAYCSGGVEYRDHWTSYDNGESWYFNYTEQVGGAGCPPWLD